jgi:hypothetical protein
MKQARPLRLSQRHRQRPKSLDGQIIRVSSANPTFRLNPSGGRSDCQRTGGPATEQAIRSRVVCKAMSVLTWNLIDRQVCVQLMWTASLSSRQEHLKAPLMSSPDHAHVARFEPLQLQLKY